MTISNKSSFFKQTQPEEDVRELQTSFRLVNGTVQGLKEIEDSSISPVNIGLFMHVQGPTNYVLDNLTMNNTILYSKANLKFCLTCLLRL